MIVKGGNPSPVKVNKGMKGYNVWVYSKSYIHSGDGIIRHQFQCLTTHGKYHRREDAVAVGWDYINSRAT